VRCAPALGREGLLQAALVGPAPVLTRYNLQAQTADQFLVHQWWLDHDGVLVLLQEMEQQYDRPVTRILDTLEKLVPEFAQTIRAGWPK
jgi:hypothetical protein